QDEEPHGGNYHLLMDNAADDGEPARSELTLQVDLEGAAHVVLRFWAIGSLFGSATAPPPSPFLGGADFDGVAISMDGLHWYEVQSLRSLSFDYAEFVVPLDGFVAAKSLTYTRNFRIRFNGVSEYGMPLAG